MTRACLWLLAGVYALQLSSFPADSDLTVVVLLAALASLMRRKIRCLGLVVAGGAVFLHAAIDVMESRIAPRFVGDSIITVVRIVDFPRRNGLTVSLVAESLGNVRVPRRLRVSWYEPPVEIRLGDIWQLELRLHRPRGNSNPGAFDYESWLLTERIGATGYVVNGSRNHLLRSTRLSGIERLRQHVVDRMTTLIPDSRHAATLAAISVGARHLITPEQWARYSRSGTSHLMAISGLHVGLAAAGGYILASVIGGLLRFGGNLHVAATITATIVASCYTMCSGAGVPALRASLMIAIAAAAVLARRQVIPWTIMAMACVLIVVLFPLATMAAGFKLSFLAVIVLIWFARRYPGPSERQRILRPVVSLRQLGAMQVMLLFGLLPVTVAIFSRIVFAAPFVNLLAVPVFSFVTVPFTLAGLLLDGSFEAVGDRALLLAAASLGFIEWLIAAVADWPWSGFTVAAIRGPAWLYVVLPLAWVALPPGWPGRGVAVVATAALVLHTPARAPAGCIDVDVLDVGQGLAIVATTRGHTVVYDTGPAYRGGGTSADTVVTPYLLHRGIDRIDELVVSHADLDHSGGLEVLLSNFDVVDLLAGEPPAGFESDSRRCVSGDGWRHDGIEFGFVHPHYNSILDGNNASCVLMIRVGEHRLLLTGDIEQPVEEQLLRDGVIGPVDALIVPHHGSRTSSSLPFVRALRPKLAIVSAGFGNRWGLPKPEVVDRWKDSGAEVLITSTSGAVGLRLCKDSGIVSVTRHRQTQRRIWHE